MKDFKLETVPEPPEQPRQILEHIEGSLPMNRRKNVGRTVEIKVVDDATVLTTGDGKVIWCVPTALDGAVIQEVAAFVTTVSSSGTPTIQLRNITNSADILSTRVTIDADEYTSYTATTAPVITRIQNVLRQGDLVAIDVDVAGTGTKGLGVILELQ